MWPPMGGGLPGLGPGLGPSAGPSALDQPPPSPTPMGGGGPGGPFSPRGLVPPGAIPSSQMPPEILTGLTQSAQAISDMLDAWSQVTPNRGAQLALIKDMLQQYLADVMSDGAGPVSPTASGSAFPGGGIDRGLAGPGAI
ncbi:MAG TPA: hypothetical protein VIX41_07620 [Acidimicrobiales bacterium]